MRRREKGYFWSTVAKLVALEFGFRFTKSLIENIAEGLYRSGACKDIFDKAEKLGYEFGKMEGKEDRCTEDKVVGFKNN